MLRLYKPIVDDDIFKLHKTLETLVCDVWCKADDNSFEEKFSDDLKKIVDYTYKKDVSFKSEIERIYNIFKSIDESQRKKIIDAFKQAEQIEQLCIQSPKPILLGELHETVEKDIKPLFKWCYEDLLDKKKVGGDKLQYYKKLIKQNKFKYCPCCGLIDFESDDDSNEVREAYDHYLPKSEFPFASVSFKNLVPLCYKCNSDRKKAKNPIENDRIAYYPFIDNPDAHSIEINSKFDLDLDENKDLILNNMEIILGGDKLKSETWNWLFDIEDQYSRKIRRNAQSFLRDLKERYRNKLKLDSKAKFSDFLIEEVELYEKDIYYDWRFLKIAIIKHLLTLKNYIVVYEK